MGECHTPTNKTQGRWSIGKSNEIYNDFLNNQFSNGFFQEPFYNQAPNNHYRH
jgi:hypothetical protein